MEHPAEALKERTKQFALRIISVIRSLPAGSEGRIIGNQLLRSGISVAANYRAVCRARSRPEFLAKLAIVIEETDESACWLELLVDAGLVQDRKLKELKSEANQLTAIFNASRTTARKGVQSAINNQQSTIPNKKAS
ncbi:MAG: four helix bundle protein [Candidatus Sulfotelmatobacter sp.]|jgi:four helix bundle protein